MNLHANSRTCPHTRLLLCQRVLREGWKIRAAAEAAGCSSRTAAKWLARYRAGDQRLIDRSSRPQRSPSRLPQQRVEAIEAGEYMTPFTTIGVGSSSSMPARWYTHFGWSRATFAVVTCFSGEYRCELYVPPYVTQSFGSGLINA